MSNVLNALIDSETKQLGFKRLESKSPSDTGFTSKAGVMHQWQHYIEQKIGFVLPNEQSRWLSNAVEHTAAEQGLSLPQLWNAVQVDQQLQQQLLDTVLIPESRFFRHKPSIEFVTQLAKQHHIQASKNSHGNADHINLSNTEFDSKPFRIWSVGCAAGQEVWSLAMALSDKKLTNYLILGTDVNQQALIEARKGQYNQQQYRLIPAEYQRYVSIPLTRQSSLKPYILTSRHASSRQTFKASRLNQPHFDETAKNWQIAPELHKKVDFVWHNIFTQNPATPYLQQVILCQNVLIYFRQFDQRDILTRLAAQCVVGGYIVLAPGEALFWRPSNMRRVAHLKVNAWQKISA